MKKIILGVLLGITACGSAEEVSVSRTNQGLNAMYERIFGWGTIEAGVTKSATGGPGPVDKNTSIVCYTEQLPCGIDYNCGSPADGAIQMNITNNNDFTVFVGNRWAGATF